MDNTNMLESTHSTKMVDDKRLRLNISALKGKVHVIRC